MKPNEQEKCEVAGFFLMTLNYLQEMKNIDGRGRGKRK